jgi:hypothetical protein
MKWESVRSAIGYSGYTLWNNGRKLVTLVFNTSSRAARIDYGGEKRVFLLRKEGFRKNRIVLRNEYGVRMGYAGSDVHGDFIELNNERFFYDVDTDNKPAITIYKESKDHPLAKCDLNLEDKDMIIDLAGRNRSIKDDTRYSLLMTLCWYLFQPAKAVRKDMPLELSVG